MVGIVAGGAWFSTRSAVLGPVWAVARTRAVGLAGMVTMLLGLGLLVVEPRWLGPAVTYLGLMVLLTGLMMRGALSKLAVAGGFDELSVSGRARIIARAKAWLAVGSVGFLASGILVGGVAGTVMVIISMVLFANRVALARFR